MQSRFSLTGAVMITVTTIGFLGLYEQGSHCVLSRLRYKMTNGLRGKAVRQATLRRSQGS